MGCVVEHVEVLRALPIKGGLNVLAHLAVVPPALAEELLVGLERLQHTRVPLLPDLVAEARALVDETTLVVPRGPEDVEVLSLPLCRAERERSHSWSAGDSGKLGLGLSGFDAPLALYVYVAVPRLRLPRLRVSDELGDRLLLLVKALEAPVLRAPDLVCLRE